MFGEDSMTWLWLLGLGALHGVNPGMGWLFAVALGLQERSVRAVWRALLPLAIGHALAIGVAVALLAAAGLVAPPGALKWIVVASLLTLGVRRLVRHRHPRRGGMQVSRRDLVMWSFLMASAHGAGLMVLPIVMASASSPLATVHAQPAVALAHGSHVEHMASAASSRTAGVAAAVVHTIGYLIVTALLALFVYAWAGLRLLRSAWINLDFLWAGALVGTAVITAVW